MTTPGVIYSESEFDGVGGACGPNAGAMAECWAKQQYIGKAAAGETATSVFYHRMRAAGRCDPSGVVSVGRRNPIAEQLADDGVKSERCNGAWLPFARSKSAAGPVVFVALLQAAHVLRDELTGAGMDAGPNLSGHYIMLAEYHGGGLSKRSGRTLPEGFYCADGDSDVNNPVVNGHRTRRVADHRLVFYPASMLVAAELVDLLAVYPAVSFAASAPQLPAGYTWDAATGALRAPNGVTMRGGIAAKVRADLLAGTWQAGYPATPEFAVDLSGPAVVEPFGSDTLVWRPGFAAPQYADRATLAAMVATLAKLAKLA